jgi:hypothetical protein
MSAAVTYVEDDDQVKLKLEKLTLPLPLQNNAYVQTDRFFVTQQLETMNGTIITIRDRKMNDFRNEINIILENGSRRLALLDAPLELVLDALDAIKELATELRKPPASLVAAVATTGAAIKQLEAELHKVTASLAVAAAAEPTAEATTHKPHGE